MFCGLQSSLSEQKKSVSTPLRGDCDFVYWNLCWFNKISKFTSIKCTCIVIFSDFCVCVFVGTHAPTLVCSHTHAPPQGLCSCAPSVALRGLKPICLSAAQNADRQTSTRLTQCWDWNGARVGRAWAGRGCCRWSRGAAKWGVGIDEVRRVEGEGEEDTRLSACMCACLKVDVLVRPASYGLTSAGHILIAGSGVKCDSWKCSHVLLCPYFCPPITEMHIH